MPEVIVHQFARHPVAIGDRAFCGAVATADDTTTAWPDGGTSCLSCSDGGDSDANVLYLHKICPGLADVDPYAYDRMETEIYTPALEKLGYTVGKWYTSEGDSFGPLSRSVAVTKDGQSFTVWYG